MSGAWELEGVGVWHGRLAWEVKKGNDGDLGSGGMGPKMASGWVGGELHSERMVLHGRVVNAFGLCGGQRAQRCRTKTCRHY